MSFAPAQRKFASDLMDQPLKVLADLGGWKRTQTIIECYQRPNQKRLKEALGARRTKVSGSQQRELTAGIESEQER